MDELLPDKKIAFDFTDTPITDVMEYVTKNFNLKIVNKYPLTDRVTYMPGKTQTAREAISFIDETIIGSGYTMVETVVGDPPHVMLTVVPTKVDAGKLISVHYGNDPDAIPEDDTRRTQVLTYKAVDPEMAKTMILGILGKQTDLQVNPATKTIVITDTGAHVHVAAGLLRQLELQAAPKPDAGGK